MVWLHALGAIATSKCVGVCVREVERVIKVVESLMARYVHFVLRGRNDWSFDHQAAYLLHPPPSPPPPCVWPPDSLPAIAPPPPLLWPGFDHQSPCLAMVTWLLAQQDTSRLNTGLAWQFTQQAHHTGPLPDSVRPIKTSSSITNTGKVRPRKPQPPLGMSRNKETMGENGFRMCSLFFIESPMTWTKCKKSDIFLRLGEQVKKEKKSM